MFAIRQGERRSFPSPGMLQEMGVSNKHGPEHRFQNSRALILKTPKDRTPNSMYGNSQIGTLKEKMQDWYLKQRPGWMDAVWRLGGVGVRGW